MTTLAKHAAATLDMVPHIATLSRLAAGNSDILELGVRTGVSTWALLDGMDAGARLASVDIIPVNVPERVSKDPRWSFYWRDDMDPNLHPLLPNPVGMVFIDTTHEYHHTLEELALADRLEADLIVLHDYALTDVFDAVTGFCIRRPYHVEGVEESEWGMAWLRRS